MSHDHKRDFLKWSNKKANKGRKPNRGVRVGRRTK